MTLIILLITAISIYLFTVAYRRNVEKGLVERGTALTYSLSKAAEEGLVKENLDLLKRASYIVRSNDVVLVQVFSTLWDAVDAYPFARLTERPHPDAVTHFQQSSSSLAIEAPDGFDFYLPIQFSSAEDIPKTTIGFVRLSLSSTSLRKELRSVIVMNIFVALAVSLFAIISINVIIGRLVLEPIMSIHRAVSGFKKGVLPGHSDLLPVSSAYEFQDLSHEFLSMAMTIKEKENKLLESHNRIRSLFERVEHAIFRLDAHGDIIEVNGRFEEIFGKASSLCDILAGEMNAGDCLMRAASDKGLHVEDKALGKKGDELIVSLSLYPEKDANGVITGYDGYLIDITDRKRFEERLIRSQKMEAIGTLAGGMAHEFNNLLTAVLGYASIILAKTHEGDPFHKPASIIHDAAKRGADFGKKILMVTRKEKMEAKQISVNEIVKSTVELLQRSMPKNIELSTSLNQEIPLTRADPSQLQQVVINMVVNACDAMSRGGKLSIETAMVGVENGAANNIQSEKGFIKLSISDTGEGIDTEKQKKIFDPFFTTKETGKGTGLGLYIVHSIINNHGGYINVYSEPSKGTTFNIYLPVMKGPDAEEQPAIQDLSGTGTILTIDDESHVRELCRDMLEPLGYRVLTAESGSTGISIYREMKNSVSLVILDIIMPNMSGREVFQILKTLNPDIRILLCSGYSNNGGFAGIDDLLQSGAAGFVQKPFSRRTIALAIKKALNEKPIKNQE